MEAPTPHEFFTGPEIAQIYDNSNTLFHSQASLEVATAVNARISRLLQQQSDICDMFNERLEQRTSGLMRQVSEYKLKSDRLASLRLACDKILHEGASCHETKLRRDPPGTQWL